MSTKADRIRLMNEAIADKARRKAAAQGSFGLQNLRRANAMFEQGGGGELRNWRRVSLESLLAKSNSLKQAMVAVQNASSINEINAILTKVGLANY